MASGKKIRTLILPKDVFVFHLIVMPDGKRLITASGEIGKPGEIKIWDLETGKETMTLRGHSGFVNSLAISADGTPSLLWGRGDRGKGS